LPADMEQALHAVGALGGKAQSGNQALFLAIFLCHARDRLGRDVDHLLKQWVDLHFRSMNRWGFWGSDAGPTHLHFQNGYHQYEVLEYLAVENPRERGAVDAVSALADPQGHFAPYPGGGGCYDYDAVFVLTPNGSIPNAETASLLRKTAATLLSEQCPDGGFCESLYVRPRSPANLLRFAGQIRRALGNPALPKERTRYALALQRPAHDRV
ncbi:hypothetical protein ACKGJN_16410, partial [Gillisia sp. Q332]|uniref:hypothetical protein n=1 Tax=Gillisia xinjiangensis TaxID=3384765 RepID=UPI00391A495F